MLADRRSQALIDNFAGQWLYLRNLPGQIPNSNEFPDFDDNLRQAFRRESELFFNSIVRENQQHRQSADGELHVRQRAPGQALRHPECVRQPVPPRHGGRSEPDGAARAGRGADDDVARRPDVSGSSRQVDPREHPRHAAAAAARQRAAAQGQEHAGEAADDAGADGRAPRERGVRELPQADGSDWLSLETLRRGGQVARHRRRAGDRSDRPAGRRDQGGWSRSACARRCCGAPRSSPRRSPRSC